MSYFQNPTTGYKQYRGALNGGFYECGEYTFTTTSATVEVPTNLSRIYAAIITAKDAPSGYETFYCDKTITNQQVTVSRAIANLQYHFAIDNGQIGSNNLGTTPLFVATQALTLVSLDFYLGTAFGGGTVTLDLEKVGSANYFLAGGSVTNTSTTTTSFTSFAQTAIADGDVVQANTNGGTVSNAEDIAISIVCTPAYTSGLVFNYYFLGLA